MSQKIRIKLKSYDHALVDKSTDQLVKTVKSTGAVVSGPIPLPTDKKIFTVNRSTFVNKKAREQFELSSFRRLVDIYSSNPKTIDALMRLLSGEPSALTLKQGSYVNSHVAVYDPFVRKYHYEKFLTTLRTTHNIPSIGLVATLTTQLNVYTANWTAYLNDEAPRRYISNDDGQVYEFTAAMAADPEYRYMVGQLSESRFIRSHTIPTLVFNLNVSKEIRDFLTASFYVNNLFNSRPLDPSEINKGSYTELNNPMYFGFEIKLKI